ncbi:MAG: 5-formyltetrahydrofolate cyclo-ligase [Calditerrivibrio sp.]|nr:5-formyltetrahydrofolate cyclo-ligase [Calditerrivibrio sp.]
MKRRSGTDYQSCGKGKKDMVSKAEIRCSVVDFRKTLDINLVETKSKIIQDRFLNLYGDRCSYLVYWSVGNEVRTKYIIDTLYKKDALIFLPKHVNGLFLPCKYEGDDKMITGKYGIQEPESNEVRYDFDVVVIPLVAFDVMCNRVGMGKGVYDRILEDVKGVRVGLAYQFQLVQHIEIDPWDKHLDIVITEENIYRR